MVAFNRSKISYEDSRQSFIRAVRSFQAHRSAIKLIIMQCGAETKIPHKIKPQI